MRVLCPHCQNPIDLVDDFTRDDIVCASCGSSFRLEQDATTAWNPTESQRRLGKFFLLDRVGIGAFGTVYKAKDSALDRVVAIKVPRAGNLASSDDMDRFLREARSVARLRHPSIVPVYEVGLLDSMPYLVSEFVHGMTLADRLTTGKPAQGEAAELLATVADALQYAHDQGVVHRDVKPSNILLDAEGRPHLMDFGLAKREAGEITMTVAGQVLGTPAYMSPEQARGEAHHVDGRSDVYSVGVILYEMLAGRLPFRGATRALLHQVQHEDPPALRKLNPQVSRDLETICRKCLRKEPQSRYATAGDLAADLGRFLAGEPIHARPPGHLEQIIRWVRRRRETALVLGGALAAAVLLVAFGFLGKIFPPSQDPETPPNDPPLVKDSLPLELELVPRNAVTFFSIRAADLSALPDVGHLEQLTKPVLGAEFRAMLAEAKVPGMEWSDVERFTSVILKPRRWKNWESFERAVLSEKAELSINRTVRPYDRTRVLKELGTRTERMSHGDQDYFVAEDPKPKAVHFINDKTYVEGFPEVVQQFLERRAVPGQPGPLRPALKLAAASEKHHVVVGFAPPPGSFDELADHLPAEIQKIPGLQDTLAEIQSVVVALHLHTGTLASDKKAKVQVEVRLVFTDDAAARHGLAASREILKYAQKHLSPSLDLRDLGVIEALVLKTLDPQDILKPSMVLLVQAEQALRQCEIRQEQETVHVRLILPDFAQFTSNLVDLTVRMARWETRKKLGQIQTAMLEYHKENSQLPPPALLSAEGKPLLSWRVLLLPYLGEKELFAQFKLDQAWDSPHNKNLLEKIPPIYDESFGTRVPHATFYQVFVGKGTLFEDGKGVALASVTDGPEQTLLVAEALEPVPWTSPRDLSFAADRPLPGVGGFFPDQFHAVFCAGPARSIQNSVQPKTLRALITRSGGAKVDLRKVE